MQKEFVGAAWKAFEIVKKLGEAVIDHGGSEQLLDNIRTDPALAAALAKKIVGPIWDLVDSPFDLDVDWASTLPQINAKMRQRLNICQYLFEDHDPDEPSFKDHYHADGKWRYRLVHFLQTVEGNSVYQKFAFDNAGYRELCTFFTQVQVPKHVHIAAMRSYEDSRYYQTMGPTWVTGMADDHEVKIEYYNSRDHHFDPTWFFLIRVPAEQ